MELMINATNTTNTARELMGNEITVTLDRDYDGNPIVWEEVTHKDTETVVTLVANFYGDPKFVSATNNAVSFRRGRPMRSGAFKVKGGDIIINFHKSKDSSSTTVYKILDVDVDNKALLRPILEGKNGEWNREYLIPNFAEAITIASQKAKSFPMATKTCFKR